MPAHRVPELGIGTWQFATDEQIAENLGKLGRNRPDISGGDELDANFLAGLAHGLHALAMCDKVLGGWSVLGDSTDLTASLADLAGLTSGITEWNLSQVAFSGAKLCATLALSGNTTATIAINAAERAYKTYAG